MHWTIHGANVLNCFLNNKTKMECENNLVLNQLVFDSHFNFLGRKKDIYN